MASRDRLLAVVAVALVLLAVLLGVAAVAFPGALSGLAVSSPSQYETATVSLIDANGTQLDTTRVRIADTRSKRYVGLSDTRTLADGEGMLFVHPREGTHAYVMRNMSFPLDIVFVDANGTVTVVRHAATPPPGRTEAALRRYRGSGKYVLEVPRGYANRTGLDAGDRVAVPPSV